MENKNWQDEAVKDSDIKVPEWELEPTGAEQKENMEASVEAEPSVAEKRLEELKAETKEIPPDETVERRQTEIAQINALSAEIRGGKVEGVESQDQLASDYLAAYSEYRKIADKRSNDLRILDDMRAEAVAPNLIAKQEELFASSREEEKEALDKYSKIGEKLTDETKEKYLVSQDQLASDYLAAYGEYRKLMEESMQNLRQLDSMRDEVHLIGNFTKAESDIADKEKEQTLLSEKITQAMNKYSKIGEKLTPETKDKYLK